MVKYVSYVVCEKNFSSRYLVSFYLFALLFQRPCSSNVRALLSNYIRTLHYSYKKRFFFIFLWRSCPSDIIHIHVIGDSAYTLTRDISFFVARHVEFESKAYLKCCVLRAVALCSVF